MQASRSASFISESSRRCIDSKLFELQESILAGPVPQDRLASCAPWFAQKHLQVNVYLHEVMETKHEVSATLLYVSIHNQTTLSLFLVTQDVVEERALLGTCGWPLCGEKILSSTEHQAKFRISLREHRIYERTESSKVGHV
jgi:Rtr1/RPAP2 family